MGVLGVAQALGGGDVTVLDLDRWDDACTRRHAIDQDGTGTALTQTATELGAVEPQVVAQHMQKRGRRGQTAMDRLTIDLQTNVG